MTWLQKYKAGFYGIPSQVWVLSLVLLINRAGAMVLPFLGIYLTDQMGFSEFEAGIILSSYGVGSIAGTLLGGQLADRFPYKWVQFFSLLASGVMFFVMTQCGTFWSLCIVVAITTFMADIFRPANMASIRGFTTEENRTRSLALQRLAINLGFGIGPAIGGYLAYNIGFEALFWVDGATCIAAGFILLALLPLDKMSDRAVLTKEEEEMPVKMTPQFWLIILSVVFYGFAFFQLIYTFPVFLSKAFAMDEDTIGWIMALNGILIFLIEMPIVDAIEKRKNKFRILYWGVILCLLAHAALVPSWQAPFTFALIYMVLVSVGEILYLPFIASLALNISHPKRVGRNMALFSVGFGLAHITGPSIGLFVVEKLGYYSFWALTLPIYAIVLFLTFRILKIAKQKKSGETAVG